MKRSAIRILIMRAPGTNCDAETLRAFLDLGVNAEVIHTQRIFRERNLFDYNAIVFPGGFSYGDYVRSGAIWAKECEYKLGAELEKYVDSGRAVLGICNGFQMLVEMGFLPGFRGKSRYPEAALGNNTHGYQCRWVRVKNVNNGACKILADIPNGKIMQISVAHGEGRFLLPKDEQDELLKELYDGDQLVFRYVEADGSHPDEEFWGNPNGAFHDIAGICNPAGNVLGLMPHPERAYFGWQMPDWTESIEPPLYGDGRIILESMVNFLELRT